VPATASKTATSTKPSIKILYGESDEKTLATHADEMKKAGHQVTTALHRKGVLEQLGRDRDNEKYDLVILGSTLSKDDRHHLPYMVKKTAQGTKVLVMHAAARHHEVDAVVDSGMSLAFLLEKIAAVVQPVKR
jgi:DNA-binding NtrC family response regulator